MSLPCLVALGCEAESTTPAPLPTPVMKPANTPPGESRTTPELERTLSAYDGLEALGVNVLLISLDSVRSDFLSCYGYSSPYAPEEKSSPNIDRIAADGVVMEDYRANTSWTLPSHMSMMSGQPDLVHGVDNGPYALSFDRPTLAAVLQRAGYFTAGFYTGPYCHERFGFDQGFDRYESAYGPEAERENQKRARGQQALDRALRDGDLEQANRLFDELAILDTKLDLLSHRDRSSTICTDKTIAAIDEADEADQPWFVFAHYFDPHYDYDPPAPYDTKFDPEYDGDLDGRGFFSNPKIRKRRRKPPTHEEGTFPGAPPRNTERAIGDRDLEHILALYAGEIAWTDAEIGRIFDHLRQKGTLDRTLVIVTADHGEEFFEHGNLGHRQNLLEEQLKVPMVLRLPDVLPAGARVQGLACHEDIMPTVLEVLGLPVPDALQSRSMMPLIAGEPDDPDRHAFGRLLKVQRGRTGPPVQRITLRETFQTGTIKVFRYRHYREPVLGECPEERAAKVRELAAEARNNDLILQWIDLAENPGEQPGEFSSDFSSPRAAAALEAFQSYYARLLQQPRDCRRSFGGEAAWMTHGVEDYARQVRAERAQLELKPPGL